jgi:hypothetical protein
LTAVQARGNIICGVNGQLPAFSYLDPAGAMVGFDADFCRALAAAVFGDATKVEFRPLTTQERFTALQTSEIDVLMRNTTWSLVRDTELGLNFTAVTFMTVRGSWSALQTVVGLRIWKAVRSASEGTTTDRICRCDGSQVSHTPCDIRWCQ